MVAPYLWRLGETVRRSRFLQNRVPTYRQPTQQTLQHNQANEGGKGKRVPCTVRCERPRAALSSLQWQEQRARTNGLQLDAKEQTLSPGVASIGQTDDVVGHDVTLLTRKSRFETGKGE